jgi:glycosyltransferase involved in cell wall biosynthesis
MHVLMISDLETQGGAAVAASRLADALCQAGHQVTRLVHLSDRREHDWKTVRLTTNNGQGPSLPLRVVRRLLPDEQRQAWDERDVLRHLREGLAELRPDVINIHNLHAAATHGWSLELVRACAAVAPTVWTLHDMWSFTGRCAYSYDCRKFLTGCDATCPTPTEYPALVPERIAGAWEQRRRLFEEHSHLIAVTPSRWMAREAIAGLWGGHRIEVIPYGLPLDVYKPVDRDLARKALEIEARGPVLLTAAQNLTERRKGSALLGEALKQLKRQPVTLVTLGSGRLNLESDGQHVHALGFVDHERTKVLAYSAADLFVHAAPVDNLPNVVMEAIACGTPVVGFSIGGVPDMVRPGETGWLAQEVTGGALAAAIDIALDDVQRSVDLRPSCRAIAESEYSDDLQAQRYVALFQSLCEDKERGREPVLSLTSGK